ncbi:hypothetical protein ACJZ2D_000730 [Fusarium nematophilum]
MAPTHISLAENINLLHLLSPKPSDPSSTRIETTEIRETGYKLSFDDERSLVRHLAFLSSVKVDIKHIPALCVQEDHDLTRLTVLAAVNKAKPGDGRQALEEMGQGFERIFGKLSRVKDKTNPSSESDVFQEIISMCRERILHRLRLRRDKKNRAKPSMEKVIQKVLDSLSRASASENTISSFEIKADQVLELLKTWTDNTDNTDNTDDVDGVDGVDDVNDADDTDDMDNSDGPDDSNDSDNSDSARLGDLVKAVYNLRKIENFNDLVNCIPDMQKQSRDSFKAIIKKMSAWFEVYAFQPYICQQITSTGLAPTDTHRPLNPL